MVQIELSRDAIRSDTCIDFSNIGAAAQRQDLTTDLILRRQDPSLVYGPTPSAEIPSPIYLMCQRERKKRPEKMREKSNTGINPVQEEHFLGFDYPTDWITLRVLSLISRATIIPPLTLSYHPETLSSANDQNRNSLTIHTLTNARDKFCVSERILLGNNFLYFFPSNLSSPKAFPHTPRSLGSFRLIVAH